MHAVGRSHNHGGLKAVALVVAAWLMLCCFTGCILPDRIMQKIYEDNERYPYDETVAPVLVNDPDAEKTSELLPKISQQEEAERQDETVMEDPEYSEEQSTTETTVNTPIASDVETNQAGMNRAGDAVKPNSSEQSEPSNSGEDVDSGDGEDDPGTIPDDSKKDDDEDPDDDNSARDTQREADEYVVDIGEEAQDIPENVQRIAAVGDAATIVAMLGGSVDACPLVAADQNFIDANAEVLRNRGVSSDSVAAIWSGDGSTESTLTEASFDQLLDSVKPDLVLYPTSADALADSQIVKLKDAGVPVWAVDMRSNTGILSAVITIGETLQQGGNQYASQRSADYLAFYNAIIDGIGDAASASRKYTLYVSDWDAGARYGNSDFDSSHGVGIAQLGSKASPLVYYLDKAGVTNTAAAGPKFSNATANRSSVVWQLKANYAANKYADFTSLDKSKATFDLTGGSGFDNALLYSSEGGAFTDAFPGLIVATQKIRNDYLLPDMMLANGLYHPFGSIDAGSFGTVVGYKPGAVSYESAIGFVSGRTTSVLYDEAGVLSANYVDHVYVNPHGLYSSWTDGSIESVLEVPWAYAAISLKGNKDTDVGLAVNGASTPSSIAVAFYEEFYGYSPSADDLSTIFSGLVE